MKSVKLTQLSLAALLLFASSNSSECGYAKLVGLGAFGLAAVGVMSSWLLYATEPFIKGVYKVFPHTTTQQIVYTDATDVTCQETKKKFLCIYGPKCEKTYSYPWFNYGISVESRKDLGEFSFFNLLHGTPFCKYGRCPDACGNCPHGESMLRKVRKKLANKF